MERSRAEVLAAVSAALAEAGVARDKYDRAVASATVAGSRCRSGVLRGQCPRCNGCPGFCAPKLMPSRLAHWRAYCANCGCADSEHEALREKEEEEDR